MSPNTLLLRATERARCHEQAYPSGSCYPLQAQQCHTSQTPPHQEEMQEGLAANEHLSAPRCHRQRSACQWASNACASLPRVHTMQPGLFFLRMCGRLRPHPSCHSWSCGEHPGGHLSRHWSPRPLGPYTRSHHPPHTRQGARSPPGVGQRDRSPPRERRAEARLERRARLTWDGLSGSASRQLHHLEGVLLRGVQHYAQRTPLQACGPALQQALPSLRAARVLP